MSLTQDILKRKLARRFRYYQSVDSTNNLAKTWLLEGAPDGVLVIADEQVRGRGRRDRVWHSPPGAALALSLILKPDEANLALVNMVGALSVYDLARQVGCDDAGIKWPNDVQVNGKKVSGILVENVWENDRLVGVVLGIGLNVRVDFLGTKLQDLAISLEDVTQARLDRAELLRNLLQRIDYWYRMKPDEVFRAWKKRLNMLGKRVTAEGVSGVALDVTPAGALLVKCDAGEVRQVYAGDISVADGPGSVK